MDRPEACLRRKRKSVVLICLYQQESCISSISISSISTSRTSISRTSISRTKVITASRRIRMPTLPYLSALAQLLICETEISNRYLSVLSYYTSVQPLAECSGCCLPDCEGTAPPAVPASYPSVCCWSAGFCGRALGIHRRRVANERHTARHDVEEGQVDGDQVLTRR